LSREFVCILVYLSANRSFSSPGFGVHVKITISVLEFN
jgi:hypothetical protein